MDPFSYQNPAITEIRAEFLAEAGIQLCVLREDQNNALAGGNKWWKLKYNMEDAVLNGSEGLLTFGGAWSNHIRATAAAARVCGLKSAGVIRGEKIVPLNPVLAFAVSQGMELRFISRELYRQKTSEEFVDSFRREFEGYYFIPEGGSNANAFKGCSEWGALLSGLPFDHFCLPAGTGMTTAGIINGLKGRKKLTSFAVLKGDFMGAAVGGLLREMANREFDNWQIENAYHFGGYAKSNPALDEFIRNFQLTNDIALEHVYSAKMMYGIVDMIHRGKFERGTSLLAIHTGGVHRTSGAA